MIRLATGLLFFLAITSRTQSQTSPSPMSVCDLSKDFSAYRNQVVTVRGVYYYGLRQTCPQKCADGPWPSFITLEAPAGSDVFNALGKVQNSVELEAKKGKRFEIWVTVTGRLDTMLRSPCERAASKYRGYGHLGVFPAMLTVQSITDIDVKENPKSEYDYANLYRGAL